MRLCVACVHVCECACVWVCECGFMDDAAGDVVVGRGGIPSGLGDFEIDGRLSQMFCLRSWQSL